MYADRRDAGDQLARHLTGYRGRPDVLVLGLVRGGVPVAARVAAALNVPLDILVIRKLGVPSSPEVAFGALGPGGVIVHNPEVEAHVVPADMSRVIADESAELSRREARYRAGRSPLSLSDRLAIIVDDGLATGATASAAVRVARQLGASSVIVATPVGAPSAVRRLEFDADAVVCPLAPPGFGAVSRFYGSFPQTTDDEVIAILRGDAS